MKKKSARSRGIVIFGKLSLPAPPGNYFLKNKSPDAAGKLFFALDDSRRVRKEDARTGTLPDGLASWILGRTVGGGGGRAISGWDRSRRLRRASGAGGRLAGGIWRRRRGWEACALSGAFDFEGRGVESLCPDTIVKRRRHQCRIAFLPSSFQVSRDILFGFQIRRLAIFFEITLS